MKATRVITAIACVAGVAAPALADDGYTKLVPGAKFSPWWCILIIVVAGASIAVVAFKNAKRTHLD